MFRTSRHHDRVVGRFNAGGATLLGALLLTAGAAAGFFVGKRSGASHLPERESVTNRPSIPREASSASQLSSVLQAAALSSDLRERLDGYLERQEGGAAHVPSDDPQVSDPTVEDHLRSVQAEHREPLFAETNTPRLEDDLSEVSRRFDFRFENVDCRSTRCTAQLDWPSLAEARTAFKSGFSAGFTRSQCQHRMLFPDLADERARARTVLIATCEAPHEVAARTGDRAEK